MIAGEHITPTLKLVQPLGHGAMGSVWVADHLGLGIQVAVKVLSKELTGREAFVERFRREANAAAQIKSPHVVQVLDHGIGSNGEPYIVMELLEGEDLGKRLRKVEALAPSVVADIVTQVAKALARAHQIGIVHRDLKPDNLFLVEVDGELLVKVLDFGIAKHQAEDMGMTSTKAILGTPLYMSPEQLLSAKRVDHRCDLWALGVVAYRAMTGDVPFEGETVGALSVAVHKGEFPPASELVPELPPVVDAWFEKAFRRAPEERFASAKEMAEELRRAVGLEGTAVARSHGDEAQAAPPPAPAEPEPAPGAGGAVLGTPAPPTMVLPDGPAAQGGGTMVLGAGDAGTLVGTATTAAVDAGTIAAGPAPEIPAAVPRSVAAPSVMRRRRWTATTIAIAVGAAVLGVLGGAVVVLRVVRAPADRSGPIQVPAGTREARAPALPAPEPAASHAQDSPLPLPSASAAVLPSATPGETAPALRSTSASSLPMPAPARPPSTARPLSSVRPSFTARPSSTGTARPSSPPVTFVNP